jgi:predicted O-methyltransferase YrrM
LYNKKLFSYILNGYQVIRFKLNYDRKSIIIKHIKINQPLNILEIGVHKGGFAIRMLNQLSKSNLANTSYTGVDLFAEMQTKQNHKAEISMWPGSRNDVLKKIKNSAPGAKINLVQSTSYEFLVNDKNKYDLIFIDGGHSYETVKSDWELSSKLLNDQGVVFFDDFTSRNGAFNSGFGISTVVEEIDTKVWNVKIFKNMDFFQKEWGILSLKIVKVKRA